jgi:Ca-activated chloride channel family protein
MNEVAVKGAVLVLVLTVGAAGASGQDEPTFRGSVDLVALNVVVVDKRQQFVTGLGAHNFAVYEDGIRQDVSFFSAGALPLDLAILLDTSRSMIDQLSTAQRAAVGFVSALGPGDRLLVLDVNDTANILAPLSSDLDAGRNAILRTSANGNTALYNGVYLTLKELVRQRRADAGMRRQAVVLLSDGHDTKSLVSFDDVMELAKQSGISVYTITLGAEGDEHGGGGWQATADRPAQGMKALAQETGARAFSAKKADGLSGVYTTIARELANQYSLGYTSTNQRRDGGYRRVVVRAVDLPGVQLRTRAGYLAPRR